MVRRTIHFRSARRTLPRTGGAWILVFAFGASISAHADDPAPATEPPAAVSGEATPAPLATPDGGTDCEWGCLRWSKQCNVDPRGVYRCQRMCTQMGEVCN
jgi:hypothetical protein